jgi:hypothetical protein
MALSTNKLTTRERMEIKPSEQTKALTIEELLLSRLDDSLSGGIEKQVALLEFVAMLENGASGSVLKPMTEYIPRNIVIKAIGTSKTNFAKLFKRQLTARQTDEIYDLCVLWSELMVFFDCDENNPARLMETFYGRSKVRECLGFMRYGDFA